MSITIPKISEWIKGEWPIVILAVLSFFLTPRGFEPGGESWAAWAAARHLADTGEFTVLSRNPLYVTYLVPFLKLPFPISMILEYRVTHLFALSAIYLLLRSSINKTQSFILSLVLVPFLAIVEGGGTVAAIGFFSLYLCSFKAITPSTWSFMPATVLAAALCNLVYLPFVAFHLLVSVVLIFSSKFQKTLGVGLSVVLKDRVPLLLLIAFLILAFLLQSHRIDNNHMLMDPKFSPIPLSSAINIGFFQTKTWMLVEKTYEPSVWALKDWYSETPRFFGESKSIFEVFRNDPDLFRSIVFKDIGVVATIPLYFYSFHMFQVSILTILTSMLISVMLLIGAMKIHRVHGLIPVAIIFLGSAGVIAALLLTWFSTRYLMALLPVFLLLYSSYLGNAVALSKKMIYENSIIKKMFLTIGCALAFIGMPSYASIEQIKNECVVVGGKSISDFLSRNLCRTRIKILYQAHYSVDNKEINYGAPGDVSMLGAYPTLSKLINSETRILSMENTFFRSFTNVRMDSNYQIWSLPPYEDKSEYTNNFLNAIDIFFVSHGLAADQASASTQANLRYKLHIAPYLRKKISDFDIIQVPGYGDAYVRKGQLH